MPRTELPPMPRLDPANGVVMARRITHIDPGPVRSVSNAPSTEGTVQERLASYKRWATNHKAGFAFSRESLVLDIILELDERLERLERAREI
jgi:hypothetical protein